MIAKIRKSYQKIISGVVRSTNAASISSNLSPYPINIHHYFQSQKQKNLKSMKKINFTSSNIYQFGVSKEKENQYDKTEQQKNKINTDNSSIGHNYQASLKFISRLRQYSNFLSQNKDQSSRISSSTKTSDIQAIKQKFQVSGTTTQQISQSLAGIANRLQLMIKQSKKLFKKFDKNDQQKYQKYKKRYQVLLSLIKKLQDNYFKQISLTQAKPIELALYFLDLDTKMSSLIQLLYGATEEANPNFKFTPDITNDDAFSKKFQYAWDKVKIIELDPKTKAKHDIVYSLLRKSVIMVTNAVVIEHTQNIWNNQYWKKILFGLSFPFSLMRLQRAQLGCYRLWRKSNIEMVKKLLDLPQQGYIQHAKKFIYPQIRSNFFLFHSASKNKESVTSEQVEAKQTSSNIFQKSQNSGRILLLSHQNLHFKKSKPTQKSILNSLLQVTLNSDNKTKNPKKKQTVIIHMHGGGFIAMSSQLMQNHTRKWANQLQVPVFSLDYRKPPIHRFPEPLQDCIAGYKFIVEQIHEHMNIEPKNIILAGDSAGGNLACALQAHLMKQKYPILPKALFLMYPAVDLRARYTPSRLQSFSDGIFLPSLLLLCQSQYLGNDRKTQFDPLASPILLTQGYINPQKNGTEQGKKWPKDWPKTIIMAGRKDPLFDDSIRLLERLAREEIKCKLLLYKDFSHGFMSMDQVLPGCKQAINDSVRQLKELIKEL